MNYKKFLDTLLLPYIASVVLSTSMMAISNYTKDPSSFLFAKLIEAISSSSFKIEMFFIPFAICTALLCLLVPIRQIILKKQVRIIKQLRELSFF